MSCFISDLIICEIIDVIWCNLPKKGLIRIFFSNLYSPGEGQKLKDCVSRMGEAASLFAFVALLGRLRSWNHHLLNPFGSHPNIPELMLKIHEICCQLLEAMLWTLLCLFPMWKRTTRLEFSLYQLPLRPFKGNPQAAGLTEQGLISLIWTCSVNEVGMSKNARHKYLTILSNEDGSIPITYR
jgi:hypothetical protein